MVSLLLGYRNWSGVELLLLSRIIFSNDLMVVKVEFQVLKYVLEITNFR